MESVQQILKADDRELLDKIYKQLVIWKDGCYEIHERAKEARQILLLNDPKQDPPTAKHKTIQLQTLVSTFNNCTADQTENIM